jgi:hypothetical protein
MGDDFGAIADSKGFSGSAIFTLLTIGFRKHGLALGCG